jgi:choline dehydrogenase
MGLPIVDDMNGPMEPGAGYINMNIGTDGKRVSAARAFLHPASSRPNLTLVLNAAVLKVNFSGKRATGVRVVVDGTPRDIGARQEVILSAGALGSPKLLMLSGIGDASALRALGIDVVENVPGVGQNFQDQLLLLGVVFKYNGKLPARQPDSNAVEAEAYWQSGFSSAGTDINLVLHEMAAVTPEVAARFGAPPEDCITIGPALVQPASRGSIRLATSRYGDPVIIDAHYLEADSDLKATLRAIELARELGSQAAYKEVLAEELIPGPNTTGRDIEDFARLSTTSFGHGLGTCKIGIDDAAVVDPQLRVRGVQGLRVADSSVMPSMVTGPTNAPSFMIGGKAARLILA